MAEDSKTEVVPDAREGKADELITGYEVFLLPGACSAHSLEPFPPLRINLKTVQP